MSTCMAEGEQRRPGRRGRGISAGPRGLRFYRPTPEQLIRDADSARPLLRNTGRAARTPRPLLHHRSSAAERSLIKAALPLGSGLGSTALRSLLTPPAH
ncbi:hypothetical protein AAFF_G00182030 [Aldrovandia affinis]|uniref:Uncharacterized protein n=1 Tax=Aldrovandia affinis TaxID=143900 RepID=A0AAD7RKK1_9TELE|nr:hypothetical protein AAFF_G00182030 [Aldrovandia affinis]